MALDPVARPARRAQTAVSANRAVTPQVRADQLRRARLAAQPLRVAFPHLEQLRIELNFEDRSSVSPAAQVHSLFPPARAFFTYPCPHSDCDGEFQLEEPVRAAATNGPHAAHGSMLCGGARAGELGSKRPCELRLTYAITAQDTGV